MVQDKTIIISLIVISITVIEALAITVLHIDGVLLSSVIGALVFLGTGKYFNDSLVVKKDTRVIAKTLNKFFS